MKFNAVMGSLYPIFRDVFDDDEIVIDANTTANDIDGWDSLTHIRLVISIEKAFNLRFTAAEISELENVGEMVELIVSLS
ncbi:MAG: acyl carrier protein [Pseudomonadota bacterium]|nr:acyl carrier protein [Pseudomonadota bacterium]